MAVIWVVENSQQVTKKVTDSLLGNYAVRAIASLASLERFLYQKSARNIWPQLIVFNIPLSTQEFKKAEDLCQKAHRIIKRLYIGEISTLSTSSYEAACIVDTDCELQLLRVIKKLLRQNTEVVHEAPMCYKDLEFDRNHLRLRILPDQQWQNIPLKEGLILAHLMTHAGQCLSKDVLVKKVWGGVHVSRRAIDSHISRLRKRLSCSEVELLSQYGKGYCLR